MRCSLRFHDGQNVLNGTRYVIKVFTGGLTHTILPLPVLFPLTPFLPLLIPLISLRVPLFLSPSLSFLGGLEFDSFSTMLLLIPLQLIVR